MKKARLNLHSYFLAAIRKDIGASFIAFEQQGNNFRLKVIKNSKPEYFPLHGTPNDVTPARYQELQTQLKEYYGAV